MVLALPIRQGGLPVATASLPLIEEDGQRAHEREIAGGGAIAHLAMVLALSVIPPVMLFDFDPPVTSHQREQSLRIGLRRVDAAGPIAGVVGGLDHIPPPQMFHPLVDAEDLRRSCQTQGGPVYLLAPKLARFDPSMAFIARLGLRGENRPRGALWPSRRP